MPIKKRWVYHKTKACAKPRLLRYLTAMKVFKLLAILDCP